VIPTQDPEIVLSDDDRWELLSRCLHDDDLALDLRAAGSCCSTEFS